MPQPASIQTMRFKHIFSQTLLVVFMAAGCTSLNQVRFEVAPSSLDYAQFRKTKISATDGKTESVRLDLAGSGYLEMITGRSERVVDDFWRQSEEVSWQDLRKDHVMLSESETTAIFQRLVDLGMFDRNQNPKKNSPPHEIVIVAAIRFEKKIILTSEAEYLKIFKELLEKFDY